MSRRRQTIAKRLVEVQQTSAMLTTFNEVDMTAIMELRKERKDAFEKNMMYVLVSCHSSQSSCCSIKTIPIIKC